MFRAALTGVGILRDRVAYYFLDWDAQVIVSAFAWTRFVLGPSRVSIGAFGTSVFLRTVELDTYIAEKAPRQVVILGAGLDARPYRMAGPWLPQDVVFFEVDAPTTQAQKLEIVQRAKQRAPPGVFTRAWEEGRVKYAPCDFSTGESFIEKLKEAGFNAADSTTVFVLEGLTMYLEFSEVKSTLEDISKSCAPGTAVAVQVIHADAVNSPAASRFAQYGEKWKWGMQDNETPQQVFGDMGYQVDKAITTLESFRAHAPNRPVPAFLKHGSSRGKGQIVFMTVAG